MHKKVFCSAKWQQNCIRQLSKIYARHDSIKWILHINDTVLARKA